MSETRKSKQDNFLLAMKKCSLITQFVQKKKQLNNHYMELKLCVINPGGAISKLHVLDVYICVT